METAEAGPSRPRLPSVSRSPVRSPMRSARISTSKSPVRNAQLGVEVSVEVPPTPEITQSTRARISTSRAPSPARPLPGSPERPERPGQAERGEQVPTKSTSQWPEASRSPRAPAPGSASKSPARPAGSGSGSPMRPGGLEHVVEALKRVVDAPIERLDPERAPAAPASEGFEVMPLPCSLPPGFSREGSAATVSSDNDPPVQSSLRLPQLHAPQRRPLQHQQRGMPPPISGPIFVPADVFAVLTSPVTAIPSSTALPSAAPASSLPPSTSQLPPAFALRPRNVPRRPPPPGTAGHHNRAFVSIRISEKRRAELIARGAYNAFRDDEDEPVRRWASRKKHEHYAAGSNRVMFRNVPLLLARPEEMPERFVARAGPALLEPYASVLTQDRLLHTLGSYVCGWKGCGAVLASEARLARHVAKRAHAAQGAVSAESGTVYRCFWGECGGPCFERVEELMQHLSAKHVAGRLRCPFLECDMASPTLAHLQRHAVRQHAPDAPLRPRADAPTPPALPPLPPLPATAHADELCTHRVEGRQHHSAYRQEQVRARIQRLCFGGPEPDTAVGGVTMMEQLAMTPQPAEAPQRKRKRMNWGWKSKKKHLVGVKTEPVSDTDTSAEFQRRHAERRRGEERRQKELEQERYERKRLGRVWVEIPVRSRAKAGIYERPDTPPPPPVTPGSAIERREKRARDSEARPGSTDGSSRAKKQRLDADAFNTAVFDAFRHPSASHPPPTARTEGEGEDSSEAEVELGVSFDPTPMRGRPSASAQATPARSASAPKPASARSGSAADRTAKTPNGPSASPASTRTIPRHSVEVVLPRSPMVIR